MLGALNEKQIDKLLREEVIGRIGCRDDERVYVVPVTYVYDGRCVYAHSTDGLKLRMMRAHPRVCFEVERHDGFGEWRSVIAWGTFAELAGADADRGLALLLDRLAPHGWTAPARDRIIVYRLELDEKTGRFESNG
jgi:nitroimidazol reductase NimA-like FMN-containing flavoprotein (pyridoxamine 5'-phosphate oxidase superfamily)